jgi:transposase
MRPIVYIDESGFAHDMPRTHGYSQRGRRCHGTHDWNAKGRVNVIGALLAGVVLTVGLTAANVDADVFNLWLERDLLPKLPPDAVLVMDNATFHKRADTRSMVRNAGHNLEYLPSYSPDLNPIEHTWAQAKATRRRTGQTVDQIFEQTSWNQN